MRSYGGYIWTSQPPPEQTSDKDRILTYAGLGATLLGAGYAATREGADGRRWMDYIAAGTRLGGNLFPFQFGNTFRVPELLSPFVSNTYRADPNAPIPFNRWSKSLLETDASYEWLKYTTGLSVEELRSRGISRGMLGPNAADYLEWRQHPNSIAGKLVSVRGTTEHVLSENTLLQALNEEIINPLTARTGLNRIAAGQFAAANMYDIPNFREDQAFSEITQTSQGLRKVTAPYMPIPGFAPSMRGTTYLRGIGAFTANRFNLLVQNTLEQILGDDAVASIEKAIGFSPVLKQAPMLTMLGKYGVAAGAVGAGILGLEFTDHIRREYGYTGQTLGGLATSAGIGYVANRLGASNRNAFIGAAALFFGQQVMPGFDQGFTQGISTLGANLDIIRGNSFNPFNPYRRTLEGFFPGISNWTTGALLAVGGMTLSGLTLPFQKQRGNVSIAERFLPKNSPLRGMLDQIHQQNLSVRDIFYENIGLRMNVPPEQTRGFRAHGRLMNQWYLNNQADMLTGTKTLNQIWAQAEDYIKTLKQNNGLNTKLFESLQNIASRHSGTDFSSTFMREAKGFFTEAYYNFFGANLRDNKALLQQVRDLGFGRHGPTTRLGKYGTIGLALFGMYQLVTGGFLGSMQTSGELSDIYTGKKLIPVKNSRFWESGGTPFEGGRTVYFRPHQYALMMNRTREKGAWGSMADLNPFSKWFAKNFTYDLEREMYESRPYPMTSAAFQDVPIIGPLLAATIGQVIKPTKVMHSSEWLRSTSTGTTEFANVYKGSMVEPAYELGAIGSGRPINYLSGESLVSQSIYHYRELEGLPGFVMNTFDKMLFGSPNWSEADQRIATSADITSWNRHFWEAQLGGAFFSNEFLRRIFAKDRSEIQKYNPLLNNMPSWLPDEWHYGDPYTKVEWGEARLPGPGFASLHPELQNVDPEDYPLVYKYQILGDVAPLSPEFFKLQTQVYNTRAQGLFTPEAEAYIDELDSYRIQTVSQYNPKDLPTGAYNLPGSEVFRNLWGGAKNLLLETTAPIEYLGFMGIRPFQKLLGDDRSIIEQYEFERMYGTPLAFWDKPWRDWLRPSLYSGLHLLGYQGKPLWRVEADATNEYFDKLNFLKFMQLSQQAGLQGNERLADQYRWQASQTRTGVNPMGTPLSIYWTLTGEEKTFFNNFASTTDPQERKRILQMIPADQTHLYQALWSRMDQGDPTLLSTQASVEPEWLESRYQALQHLPRPANDWVGWHQDVDLTDIKVRYVDHVGGDIHDYGLWESQQRKSMAQPFLEGSEQPIYAQQRLPVSIIRSQIYNMLGTGERPPHLSFIPSSQPYANITYNDNREQELRARLGGYFDE